ncbi:MAG TPA: A24 family peptidase [Dehalococcoidia bacterium]|nr:A24 family peptidase [Dehalococcoidia bacterium]
MAVLAALIGLLLGHALELVFPRLYTEAPLGGAFYRCGACRSQLRLLSALPLAGFLRYRGRCPDCGAALPWRALVLPAGAAVLFATSALVFDEFGPALLAGAFATVFLVLTLTDFDRRLIPNRVVYPCLLLAAALSWAWPHTSAVEVFAGGLVAIALAAAMLLVSLPFGANAFGMGDVKFIVLMGLVTGLPAIIIGVFIGTLAAGVAAAFLIFTGLRGRRDYMPHGPFLALGAVIALWWGRDIWDWYVNR